MPTTTQVIEALKYTYATPQKVRYLFNNESPSWAMVGKVKKQTGGRGQHITPVWVNEPGAFTGIAEGGALPAALQPDTTEATWSLQEYTGIYDVTWKLLQDARSDKWAFQTILSMMDSGFKNRYLRNLNADLVGDGRGRLATLSGVDASGAIITSDFMPRCSPGMVVDVMDESDDDTKIGDSRTVSGVNYITREVDLSGADLTGEAAGDYLVIQDTCDISINATALHCFGMLALVDSSNPAAVVGNPGGISRATVGNEFWQSVELSNAGGNRAFTEDLGLQAEDGVRAKGGGRLKAWISNMRVARRYHEMLRNETVATFGRVQPVSGGIGRQGGGTAPADDGKSPYEFSGIPWYVDPYFNNNVIVGLDTDHFYILTGENDVPRPISDIFPHIPFFRQTNNATFEVAWYYQMEFCTDNPGAGVKITDVAES